MNKQYVAPTDKQVMVGYLFDPNKKNTSWYGMFQVSKAFSFDDEVWQKNQLLAAVRLAGGLIELGYRGVNSGDDKCIAEINDFLSTVPEHLKEIIKVGIEEVKRDISVNKILPEAYQEAASQLKPI